MTSEQLNAELAKIRKEEAEKMLEEYREHCREQYREQYREQVSEPVPAPEPVHPIRKSAKSFTELRKDGVGNKYFDSYPELCADILARDRGEIDMCDKMLADKHKCSVSNVVNYSRGILQQGKYFRDSYPELCDAIYDIAKKGIVIDDWWLAKKHNVSSTNVSYCKRAILHLNKNGRYVCWVESEAIPPPISLPPTAPPPPQPQPLEMTPFKKRESKKEKTKRYYNENHPDLCADIRKKQRITNVQLAIRHGVSSQTVANCKKAIL